MDYTLQLAPMQHTTYTVDTLHSPDTCTLCTHTLLALYTHLHSRIQGFLYDFLMKQHHLFIGMSGEIEWNEGVPLGTLYTIQRGGEKLLVTKLLE